jgi:subtilisin family serine protease
MTRFSGSRRKAVWGRTAMAGAILLAIIGVSTSAFAKGDHSRVAPKARANTPNGFAGHEKLDKTLADRSAVLPNDTTKAIVTFTDGELPPEFAPYIKKTHSKLGIISGYAIEVPNRMLRALAAHPNVVQLHVDRPLFKQNLRTSLTTGSRALQQALGITGAGVGIAVVDSGIATWHDDLTNRSTRQYPYGNQRVSAFVDFVNGRALPYDDDGHGTHVTGVIAGNGYDSSGQKAGMAPDASIVSLKVLDANGRGTISNIIAALDWVLANHSKYGIRVVNVSVTANVTESYWTDPLTLAAKRLVDAGVVVVAAAGNRGRNASGQAQYGGIGAPANAPWVLTVGASSTNGTSTRADDTMASFSSRGPTYLDWAAKPDLVAPGVGTVSMAAPGSTLVSLNLSSLIAGTLSTGTPPYLSLSGTSMAAPVVSGVVAQMLQVNPGLTPNAVKAILQYTSQTYPGYDALTEGAGFLNAVGAVRLAQFFATAYDGVAVPTQKMWSKHIIWGNHMLSGGIPVPSANAWRIGTNWGAVQTADGSDNIVWGTSCGDGTCDNIVWGTADGTDNIVWGTACADNTCDNIVWGTANGDDNIVWGTDCGGGDCDGVVWGTADGTDNIVWGTATGTDNIVWGTANGDDNIVWGTASGDDNIVWGTASGTDNIVWGTADGVDNIVWGTSTTSTTWTTSGGTSYSWSWLLSLTDEQVFAILNPPPISILNLKTVQLGSLYGGTF